MILKGVKWKSNFNSSLSKHWTRNRSQISRLHLLFGTKSSAIRKPVSFWSVDVKISSSKAFNLDFSVDCRLKHRKFGFVFTGWNFPFSTSKFPQIHHKYHTFSGTNRSQIVRRNNLQKFPVYNTWFGDNNSTWPSSFLCPLFPYKPRNFSAKSRQNCRMCNTWLRCHPYQPFHFPVQFIPSFETSLNRWSTEKPLDSSFPTILAKFGVWQSEHPVYLCPYQRLQ